MADQTITAGVLVQNGSLTKPAVASLTGANDGVFTPTKDRKVIFEVICTAVGGATVTVGVGAGAYMNSQGVLSTGAMAQHDVMMIGPLDSARFKAMSGTDKGKIRITTTGTATVSAILLP